MILPLERRKNSSLVTPTLFWVRGDSFRQGGLQALDLALQVVNPRHPILLFVQDAFVFFAALMDLLKRGEQTIETMLDISTQLDPDVAQRVQLLLQAIAAMLLFF